MIVNNPTQLRFSKIQHIPNIYPYEVEGGTVHIRDINDFTLEGLRMKCGEIIKGWNYCIEDEIAIITCNKCKTAVYEKEKSRNLQTSSPIHG